MAIKFRTVAHVSGMSMLQQGHALARRDAVVAAYQRLDRIAGWRKRPVIRLNPLPPRPEFDEERIQVEWSFAA